MIKYKSIKTYNRLREIQPVEAIIELSSKEEIDSRLGEFRDSYRAKVFPDGFGKAKEKAQSSSSSSQQAAALNASSKSHQVGGGQNKVLQRKGSLSNLDNPRTSSSTGAAAGNGNTNTLSSLG